MPSRREDATSAEAAELPLGLRELLRAIDEPVEPPGAEQRVWRRLQSPRYRHIPGAWTVAPGFGLVVAALLLLAGRRNLHPTPDSVDLTAQVALVKGVVSVRAPAERQARPIAVGERLAPGSRLDVEGTGLAYTRVDGVGMLVEGGAGLVLPAAGLDRGAVAVAQSAGSIVFSVHPRPRQRPFVVRVLGYEVRVVGTLFRVSVVGGSQVTVSVEEGTVRVTGHRTAAEVHAGETWSSTTPGGEETAARPADSAAMFTLARALLDRAPREAPLRIAAPVAVRVTLDGRCFGTGSVDVLVSPGDHEIEGLWSPSSRATVQCHVDGPAGLRIALVEPSTDPAPNLATPAGALERPQAAPYVVEAVARTRHSPSPPLPARRAMAVAVPTPPANPVVVAQSNPEITLYEVGRRRLRESHDLAGAEAAFRHYAAQYPNGVLAPEASFTLIEVLLEQGRMDAADGELRHYLAAFPNDERRPDALALRGHILRDRGDCKAALGLYQSAAGAGGRASDDALYYSAICHARLGNVDQANTEIRAYLTQYPTGRHIRDARRSMANAR